jgi:phosphoenolpyruvate carboxykinase (GTP)
MLERNKGPDIATEIGGITSVEAAIELFASKADAEQLARLKKLSHPGVIMKIGNAVAMCNPDKLFVNTGSDADREFVRKLALEQGEERDLPMKDHTIHYDLKDEQGRIVDRTFYIINEGEKVSSLGKKMLRAEAMDDVKASSVRASGSTMSISRSPIFSTRTWSRVISWYWVASSPVGNISWYTNSGIT